MSIKPISCEKCWGVCCAHLPNVENEEVQMLRTPSGMCINLGHDNKCTVYDNRPFFCNTETMYNRYYATHGISEDEFMKMQLDSCHKLRTKYPKENQ